MACVGACMPGVFFAHQMLCTWSLHPQRVHAHAHAHATCAYVCMQPTHRSFAETIYIERETNEKRNLAYEGLLRARWPCQSANISLYLSPGQAQGRRRRWQPERCEREDSRRGAGNSLFERYWALLTARRSFCEGGWASPMAGVRRRWGSSRAEGARRHRRIPPSTELQLSLCLSCAASR